MRTTIVIPTYNECDNIAILIAQIFSLNIPDLSIIVVDDNSPDNTSEIIKRFSEKFPIKLIIRPKKYGLGSAYVAGFKIALTDGADYIIQMDADLSHDPNDIPRLVSALHEVDMVIGSRKIKNGKIIGWNLWRKFMSTGAMFFARLILQLKTRDITSGFRAFRRSVLEEIHLEGISAGGYAFQEEIIFRVEKLNEVKNNSKEIKILEIPVTFTDRINGKSKLSWRDIFEFFNVIIKLKYEKHPSGRT